MGKLICSACGYQIIHDGVAYLDGEPVSFADGDVALHYGCAMVLYIRHLKAVYPTAASAILRLKGSVDREV